MPPNPDPQPRVSEFRGGETFAERYEILELLGAGPYSTVYRARDVLGNEAVALKFLAPGHARNRSVLSQYRLELNLLRQIQHPGLIRIFDSGEFLGRFYVAMELIEGITLRDHLKAVPKMPAGQFSDFFREMCEALSLLHAQHVIHRDVHPGNIMVTSSNHWKLMDFGIGRDLRRPPDSGDFEYFAPEQLMGQPLTFATDIHALGMVSCKMLTGGLPRAKRRGAPLFAETEVAGAPEGLASLIETCVQVDPKRRFQNVEAVMAAGVHVLRGDSPASGTSIEELRTESAGAPPDLTPLFARIVHALIDLHATGGDHAELSPKNIRVNGEAVEIERISKAAPTPPSQSTILISDARYTAPELLMARKTLDRAAHICGDIYVLGFVFYEFLAGKQEMRRHFAELDQPQTGLAWMRWHSDPDSKLRPLAEVAPACPKGLIDLIGRMVEKDPARRIRTLEEVAETLDRLKFLLARTQTYEMTPSARPNGRWRMTALPVAAAAALAVFAIIGSGWWLATRGPQALKFLAGGPGSWRSVTKASGSRPLPGILRTATGVMMLVPEGEFLMGNDSVPNEAPAHKVTLQSFYIDRLEVSNRNYSEFCSRTGRRAPDPPSWDPAYGKKDSHPVVNVGRQDAAAFCEFAGKRLPSEEEWEKAARGSEEPSILRGNWTLPGLANLKLDGGERPAPRGIVRGRCESVRGS